MQVAQYPLPVFISPLDPDSGDWQRIGSTQVSFAANARVFLHQIEALPSATALFTDGFSNTILFAETRLNCRGKVRNYTIYDARLRFAEDRALRPTFSDNDRVDFGIFCEDFYPVTVGQPPLSRANVPTVTFQIRPSNEDCDPRVANAMSNAGLLTSIADGSVRVFRRETSPFVYWGCVTPNQGEIVVFD
jgi:hypothetical protein